MNAYCIQEYGDPWHSGSVNWDDEKVKFSYEDDNNYMYLGGDGTVYHMDGESTHSGMSLITLIYFKKKNVIILGGE